MRTAELTGAQLDYWVARACGCENINGEWISPATGDATPLGFGYNMPLTRWEPSTDWATGGPIIDRENISLIQPEETSFGMWAATKYDICDHRISGPTPLIAAMRCYVARKYGESVPEGLPWAQ